MESEGEGGVLLTKPAATEVVPNPMFTTEFLAGTEKKDKKKTKKKRVSEYIANKVGIFDKESLATEPGKAEESWLDKWFGQDKKKHLPENSKSEDDFWPSLTERFDFWRDQPREQELTLFNILDSSTDAFFQFDGSYDMFSGTHVGETPDKDSASVVDLFHEETEEPVLPIRLFQKTKEFISESFVKLFQSATEVKPDNESKEASNEISESDTGAISLHTSNEVVGSAPMGKADALKNRPPERKATIAIDRKKGVLGATGVILHEVAQIFWNNEIQNDVSVDEAETTQIAGIKENLPDTQTQTDQEKAKDIEQTRIANEKGNTTEYSNPPLLEINPKNKAEGVLFNRAVVSLKVDSGEAANLTDGKTEQKNSTKTSKTVIDAARRVSVLTENNTADTTDKAEQIRSTDLRRKPQQQHDARSSRIQKPQIEKTNTSKNVRTKKTNLLHEISNNTERKESNKSARPIRSRVVEAEKSILPPAEHQTVKEEREQKSPESKRSLKRDSITPISSSTPQVIEIQENYFERLAHGYQSLRENSRVSILKKFKSERHLKLKYYAPRAIKATGAGGVAYLLARLVF